MRLSCLRFLWNNAPVVSYYEPLRSSREAVCRVEEHQHHVAHHYVEIFLHKHKLHPKMQDKGPM